MQFLGDKITAILTLGLYKINSFFFFFVVNFVIH